MGDAPEPETTVLVTGGSGYLASWIIVTLLRRGFVVRTTVRGPDREAEVRAMIAGQCVPQDRLTVFHADLLHDEGWRQALDACDYAMHVAFPMPDGVDHDQDLVVPALAGTERVLKAAARAGVRRLVLTSSAGAALPPVAPVMTLDETLWTERSAKPAYEYVRAKTCAERCAWDFARRAKSLELTTILPGSIVGPVLARIAASTHPGARRGAVHSARLVAPGHGARFQHHDHPHQLPLAERFSRQLPSRLMPYDLDIPGWMPEPELKILERLARTIPAGGAMAEIGPFCGRSSWCGSKSVPVGVSVTCIDIWDPDDHPYSPPAKLGADAVVDEDYGKISQDRDHWGTRANFDHYTRDCHNISALRGHSPDDFLDWPEASLDLVFLDGIHHNPGFHADVSHWFPRVRPGGILCGDDCTRSHPDVLWTIDDYCKERGIPFTVERRIWVIIAPRAMAVFEQV